MQLLYNFDEIFATDFFFTNISRVDALEIKKLFPSKMQFWPYIHAFLYGDCYTSIAG